MEVGRFCSRVGVRRGGRSRRRLLVVAAFLAAACSVLVLAGPASALVHHRVFGLDVTRTYTVIADGHVILEGASPEAGGCLCFDTTADCPITIRPDGEAAFVEDLPGGEAGRVSAPWPNPSTGRVSFALHAPLAGTATLRLIEGASGRQVWKQPLSVARGANTVQLDLPDRLGSGLYFMRIETSGKIHTRKLIVMEG